MEYVKINDNQYPATIRGYIADREWDKRDSKAITLEMSYEEALNTFVDDIPWSIVHAETDADGEIVTIEYDNSEFSVAGSITDHRNGTVTVKMGKPTQVETLQKQLANAVTEDELNAAYTEGVNSL
jgi:hypothetical protein